MRKVSSVAVIAASALALTACGSTNGGGSNGSKALPKKDVKEITIGFSGKTANAPYFVAMQKEAEKLAKEKGFKLRFQSADGDAVQQIDQVNTMVTQGVNVLLVNTVSPDTEKSQMKGIAAKVPLLFVDTPVPNVGFSAVQSDNETIGKLSGEALGKRFGKGKTMKLAVLNAGPTDAFVGPARRKGFLEGLKASGVNYKIVAESEADYVQDKAVPATENMLSAHPDIDAIFGYNDSMALGALSVLKDKGNKHVLVSGVDGQKEALKEIKDGGCSGQYVSTGLNSPSLAVDKAVDIAIKVATGQAAPNSFPKKSLTKAAGISCQDIKQYYDPKSVF